MSDTLLILPNFSSTHSVGLLPHLPTSPPLPYLHIPHPCSSCGLVVSFVSQIPWSVLSPHHVQPNSMVDAAGHPFPGHLFFTWLLFLPLASSPLSLAALSQLLLLGSGSSHCFQPLEHLRLRLQASPLHYLPHPMMMSFNSYGASSP